MTTRLPTSRDLDMAIADLASVVLSCDLKDAKEAHYYLVRAAGYAGVQLDVASEPGAVAWRLVQEYALTAAKALCTVRSPPALRPDHATDAAARAEAALTAAWEVSCGRRAA